MAAKASTSCWSSGESLKSAGILAPMSSAGPEFSWPRIAPSASPSRGLPADGRGLPPAVLSALCPASCSTLAPSQTATPRLAPNDSRDPSPPERNCRGTCNGASQAGTCKRACGPPARGIDRPAERACGPNLRRIPSRLYSPAAPRWRPLAPPCPRPRHPGAGQPDRRGTAP